MAVTAAYISAAAAVGGVAVSQDNARKARNMQKDAARHALAAQQAADTSATQNANAMVAMRRRALAKNSLMTGGTGAVVEATRTTLGGT